MTTSKPKILIVLTSADKVPKTGKQIGWFLPELAHPFHVLSPVAELVYATPKGGVSPLDPVSAELFKDDPVCKDFLENHESVWKKTLKLSDLAGRSSEFDAIFYPGGHGPMVDLVHDQHSKDLLRDFHSQDKVISAVCHGPAAFVNATTASGELILKGKQVTGFDDVGEEMFQFTEDMDFSLEKKLDEVSGGKYVKAAEGPLAEKVVVDGKMITGQNPASSKGVAEEIAKALGEPRSLIPNSASRSMVNVINTLDVEIGEHQSSNDPAPTGVPHGLTEKTLSGKDLSATQEAYFLDLFWDSWHCCYQLLEEGEFRAHYKSLWDEPTGGSRKDSPLVDIVLALCMQFGVTSLPLQGGHKAEINFRDAAVAGRWLYQRCQKLISCDLERPTLETFQCQLWSAIYLANASYQNMAQNMLGVAARTAYTLGLDIEPGNDLPIKEREARKRAWCILFMFETRSCIRLGRPWVTQTQPISPLLSTSHRCHATVGVGQTRYTTERAKLTEIARSAFDSAFNYRPSGEASTTTSDRQSNLYTSSMARMRAWAESLPHMLKTERRSGGKPLSTDLSGIEIEPFAPISLRRQRLMLELFYHELILTLGRHSISQSLTRAGSTQASPPHEAADISALHAAATTKLLYQVYREYDILNGWYEPFNCQWNAAITLVGYLLAYPQDTQTATIARTALSQSTTVLEKMGDFFGTAPSAAGVIRTLRQRLNIPVEAHMATDSNTITPDTAQDIDFNDLGSFDLSFEGMLGTFGTESEFERLGFGTDMQDFLAIDAGNIGTMQ
nr:hypothetical protein FVER53263_10010 [Fusarium verticillioides]